MSRKRVLFVVGLQNDDQLKRLLRFLDKHGIHVFMVKDVEEVKTLSKAQYETISGKKT